MISRKERETIRKSIERAAICGERYGTSIEIFGAWGDVALRDAPRLLEALDDADEEMEQLKELIVRLYKVLNLASLTECDHRCLTKEMQGQLLALLAEARGIAEAT